MPSEPSPDDDSADLPGSAASISADLPGSAAGVTSGLPGTNEARAALAAETRILAAWLEDRGRALFAATLAERPGVAVVFTTTPTGFDAAARLRESLPATDAERIAIVTEIEYRGWCMRFPDEAFRLHENLWSWVKQPVPARRRGEFAAWPIPRTHRYWLHRQGRAGAASEWRAADLWQWDGAAATLLAEGVPETARRPG